jgi:hypothetical protein
MAVNPPAGKRRKKGFSRSEKSNFTPGEQLFDLILGEDLATLRRSFLSAVLLTISFYRLLPGVILPENKDVRCACRTGTLDEWIACSEFIIQGAPL